EGAHRIRRTARHRADDPADASGRLPARGVPRRARDGRSDHDARRDEAEAVAVSPILRREVSSNLAWLDSLQGSGIRPGLGRMRAVLRALHHPERAVPAIIIAGTNGKGSTSATLASILAASGYKTGLYTSPHLIELRERWMIDGRMIDPALLESSIEKLRAASERIAITPTYFEALTLIAFIAFRDARCDLAVLEGGMCGRLDATDIARPTAALTPPIGLDHTESLGNTLRRVAAEKAGVI